MKIGVFGDSFADRRLLDPDPDRFDESWINQISLKGFDITSHGLGGTSCWYSYRNFLENHMLYDHIVFCYSFPYRIHSLPKEYEQFASFMGKSNHLHLSQTYNSLPDYQKSQIKNLLDSLLLVQDTKLDKFICQNIFDDVNRICKIKGIKLVNVLPFEKIESPVINLDNRQGDCLVNLLTISTSELPGFGSGTFSDPRYCHLSLENNKVFADIVLDCLNKPLKQITDVTENPNFVYDKKITNRYMTVMRQYKKIWGL